MRVGLSPVIACILSATIMKMRKSLYQERYKPAGDSGTPSWTRWRLIVREREGCLVADNYLEDFAFFIIMEVIIFYTNDLLVREGLPSIFGKKRMLLSSDIFVPVFFIGATVGCLRAENRESV
jgi:hypothetical protein